MTQELEKFCNHIETNKFEPWKRELAEFVINAYNSGKNIQSLYDPSLIFTPLRLMELLIEGRFVWGIVNWRLTDSPPNVNI